MQVPLAQTIPPLSPHAATRWFGASLLSGLLTITISNFLFYRPYAVGGYIISSVWAVLLTAFLSGSIVSAASWLTVRRHIPSPRDWIIGSLIGGSIGTLLYVGALVLAELLSFVLMIFVEALVSGMADPATGIAACQILAIPVAVGLAAAVFGFSVSVGQVWWTKAWQNWGATAQGINWILATSGIWMLVGVIVATIAYPSWRGHAV
jgi:hypothetical protein